VYTVNADGTGTPTPKTTTANVNGFSPSYSPDGTQIAFTSTRDGNSEIFVMNADGTSQVNRTRQPADEAEPDWQRPLPPAASQDPISGVCFVRDITSHPASQKIAVGQTATMTVAIDGVGITFYQWYMGSSGDVSRPIPWENGKSFTTPPLTTTTSYW